MQKTEGTSAAMAIQSTYKKLSVRPCERRKVVGGTGSVEMIHTDSV